MGLSGIVERGTRFIIFGGKGGVGKTTCSSAAAIHLAQRGCRTLLISVDPAHSLSDGLGQDLGDEARKVRGVEGLEAVEIDPAQSFRRFQEEFGEALREVLRSGTYLDEEDVSDVLSLTVPGLDEAMGLKRIVDLMEAEAYDRYVLDTAPTGHALRLLFLPGLLDQWVQVLARIRWKYRCVVAGLSGREPAAGEAEDFLMVMKRAVKRIGSLLKDPGRTTFVLVTLAERMAVSESGRLLKELADYGVPVEHMVVNRLFPAPTGRCPFCERTRAEQEACLEMIRSRFADLKITRVPRRPGEVRGVRCLQALSGLLFGEG